jgi:phosphoenolpyruvate-protein phosphotransferase
MTRDVARSLEFSFACRLPGGLHARPASCLAEVVGTFASNCILTNHRNRATANLKSVLAIIAADVRQGDDCCVQVTGPDEESAHAALRRFIEHDLPLCEEPPVQIGATNPQVLPRALRQTGVSCHFGTAVSRGIGMGTVLVTGGLALPRGLAAESPQDLRREQEKLERAVAAVRGRVEAMLARQASAVEAGILRAHLAIVGDISLINDIHARLESGRSAGQAIVEAGESFTNMLRRSDSLYIRERALDMQEICLQLLEQVYGARFQPLTVELHAPTVVVAETLAPQQLLALDRRWVKALVLENASTTSHTVILARSLAIPALVGTKDAAHLLRAGEEVIVDANRGCVVAQVPASVRRFYQREAEAAQRRREFVSRYAQAPAVTGDGRTLEVAANVSSSGELPAAFERGADGIGLFRTEMLFVGRDGVPSEEEQFEVYKQAARAAAGRPVIIRTLDIGGDKPLFHLNLPREVNPFLGSRGVRLYADHEDLIREQFRAIVRASAFGRVQMLLPMVSALGEVRWAKAMLTRVQAELAAQNVAFDPAMPLGIMVEVPAVSFILDQLCSEVEFFSIGTNDLAQYVFAVDRTNGKVAWLADVLHPGFLRLLKQIVDAVHHGGKWIGICGEMASEIRCLPLLVGMGLDEISVPATEIPALKERVSRLSNADCEELVARALRCRDAEAVKALLRGNLPIDKAWPLHDRELVILESESGSKEEAIRELVNACYVAGRTDDVDAMEDALWARESLYSTGFGFGFAIPHCKTDAVVAGSLAVLKLKKPVDWGATEGGPTSVAILLALRENAPEGTHMQVFSQLARKLMNEGFRKTLAESANADSVLQFLARELNIGSH